MLAAQWQAAGMAQARPKRMREMIQVFARLHSTRHHGTCLLRCHVLLGRIRSNVGTWYWVLQVEDVPVYVGLIVEAAVQASLAAAVEKAQAELGDSPDGVICITGSMHAVAEALKSGFMA